MDEIFKVIPGGFMIDLSSLINQKVFGFFSPSLIMIMLVILSVLIFFFFRFADRREGAKRARDICAERGEFVIMTYTCDPTETDVIKKRVMCQFTYECLIVDEIMHVDSGGPLDVYRRDLVQTEDGLMRHHFVDVVVQLLAHNKHRVFNRLIVLQ